MSGYDGPGWYVDNDNPEVERYFNGGTWTNQSRPVTAGAVSRRHVTRPANPPETAAVSSWLTFGAGFAMTLAVLGVLGSLIGGIALMAHKGQSCTVNPYVNPQYDTPLTCTATHPLLAAGLIALLAGLLQAIGWMVVAALCRIVADAQREKRGALT